MQIGVSFVLKYTGSSVSKGTSLFSGLGYRVLFHLQKSPVGYMIDIVAFLKCYGYAKLISIAFSDLSAKLLFNYFATPADIVLYVRPIHLGNCALSASR